MADDVKDQGTPEPVDKGLVDGKVEDKNTQPTMESVLAELAEIKKAAEIKQKEIDGLNRKITLDAKKAEEQQKKQQESEKAKMSDLEREKYEREQAEKKAADLERKFLESQLLHDKESVLIGEGLDIRLAKRIQGSTTEEAIADAKDLVGIIIAEAQKISKKEIDKRFAAAGKPGGGDKPGDVMTYKDLMSMSDAEQQKLPVGIRNKIMEQELTRKIKG